MRHNGKRYRDDGTLKLAKRPEPHGDSALIQRLTVRASTAKVVGQLPIRT
jgi:hypothetical protein